MKFILTLVLGLGLIAASPVSAEQQSTFDAAIGAAKSAMLSDPRAVVQRAAVAERIARSGPLALRPERRATAYWLTSEAYIRLNQPDAAKPFIDQGLALISSKPATALRGELLMARGGFHTARGEPGLALADYQSAHNIFREVGDSHNRAVALIDIAVLYGEASDYAASVRYYRQAQEAAPSDPDLAYWIRLDLAQALKDQGKQREAVRPARAAAQLARASGNKALLVQSLRNLARIDLLLGNLTGADASIAEAFRAADGLPHDDDFLFLINTAAQAALQHGDVAKAVLLTDRSFAGVDLQHTGLAQRASHQTAYDVYRRAGDAPKALAHLAAMKRLDDEATKLATSANAALMGARFDFANQEARIARLRADEAQRSLAFARARAHTDRLIFVGTSAATLVVIALLGVGLVTIRRSRNKVREANVVLGETNSALGKALAAKTEFLATTSHEIRTPLNGILGMTQVMLADPALDASTRDRVGIVHGAGETMKALVDDILDVAKIETGNLTVESAPMDVCRILTEVSRLWGEQASGKGLAFKVDLERCPSIVMGDAARLRQVVFNLLSNAMKFTAEGAVTLHAEARSDRYVITVTDTGIGIPQDKLEFIFESFRQGDTSTTRRFGGTGLGLSICRSLARAMGGDVTVASEPGRGSCFTLELPLVAGAEQSTASGETFLILERNPIARSVLKAIVEPWVAVSVGVGTLEEALTMMERGGVVRVLADDAALREAGKLTEAAARLSMAGAPVTLLWSAREGESEADLYLAGVAQVVARPINKSALSAVLFDNMHHSSNALVPHAA